MLRSLKYSIAILYIVAGLLLIFAGWDMLSPFQRYGLGVLIVVYGLFRFYRVYRGMSVKNQPDEEHAEE